jgi:hypothetical protein
MLNIQTNMLNEYMYILLKKFFIYKPKKYTISNDRYKK